MNHYSARFSRNVWFTHHAIAAMEKRGVAKETVLDVLETGDVIEKGEGHAWIFHGIPGRSDNLVCAAVVLGQAVVVKTVMVNWQRKEMP